MTDIRLSHASENLWRGTSEPKPFKCRVCGGIAVRRFAPTCSGYVADRHEPSRMHTANRAEGVNGDTPQLVLS